MFSTAATDLASRYGLTPVYAKSFTYPTAYDASTKVVRASNNSGLIHEVAHWLVATEAEKALDEFGLGSSPDANLDSFLQPKVKHFQLKEECSSLLGILIERHLGLTAKGEPMHRTTWSMHSWYALETKRFRKRIKLLLLLGLVRKENGKFIPCL